MGPVAPGAPRYRGSRRAPGPAPPPGPPTRRPSPETHDEDQARGARRLWRPDPQSHPPRAGDPLQEVLPGLGRVPPQPALDGDRLLDRLRLLPQDRAAPR